MSFPKGETVQHVCMLQAPLGMQDRPRQHGEHVTPYDQPYSRHGDVALNGHARALLYGRGSQVPPSLHQSETLATPEPG
jgi:hypothetical protein